jgi:hypothetical protein
MSRKYWKDEKKQIEPHLKKFLTKADFPELHDGIKFLLTFHTPPQKVEANQVRAAYARKASKYEQDVFGFDFEISVCEDVWDKLDAENRDRIVYHELLHCRVDLDAANRVCLDKEDRPVTWLEEHDLSLNTFQKEIEKFGLSSGSLATALFLQKHLEHPGNAKQQTQIDLGEEGGVVDIECDG